MKHNLYEIVLTNGTIQHTYRKYALCEREAVILVQAEAIENGRGYEVVSVKEIR